MPCARAMSLSTIAVLLAACGGGSAPPGDPVTLQGRAIVEGQSLRGARVHAFDSSGDLLGSGGEVDDTGAFFLPIEARALPPLVVEVTIPEVHAPPSNFTGYTLRENTTLRAVVDVIEPATIIVVSPVTTIVHRYRELHPDVSTAEAHSRVQAFLGVRPPFVDAPVAPSPDWSHLGMGALLTRSLDGPRNLDDLAHAIAPQVEAGRALRLPGEMSEEFDSLFRELGVRVEAVRAPSVKVSAEVEKEYLGSLSPMNLVSNVIGAVLKGISALRDYQEKQAVLDGIVQIESLLDQIITFLRQAQAWIDTRFDQADYTTLASSIQGDVTAIRAAYAHVQEASLDAQEVPGTGKPNLTDLDTQVQALYGIPMADIRQSGLHVRAVQWGNDPLSGNLISLAHRLTHADQYVNSQTQVEFSRQIATYAGYQAQAASVIAVRAQPGLLEDSAHPEVVSYNFQGYGNLAGALNQANAWVDEAVSNIQQQLAFAPMAMIDPAHVLHVSGNRLYVNAAMSAGSGGQKVQYIRSLVAGGLSKWAPATLSEVKSLIPVGGVDALNAAGFNLVPGPVTYAKKEYLCSVYRCSWFDEGTVTATNAGFLVYEISSSQIALSWIDANGGSGRIGECDLNSDPRYDFNHCSGQDLASALDSSNDFFISSSTAGFGEATYTAGQVNGPVIVVNRMAAADFQDQVSAVAVGKFQGLSVAADPAAPWQSDPGSNGASGTQGLVANPVALADGPAVSDVDLTSRVFWEALDPSTRAPVSATVAVISNLQTPDDPLPPSPQFPPIRHAIGTVHWLPGSAGANVVFRASRYMPDGRLVSGEIQLQSPVTAGTGRPDAIDVFPGTVQTTAAYLASTGFQLHVTRHWGRGWFESVSSEVTYASSNPDVLVSASGLVTLRPGAAIAPGTLVTITVTDPAATVRPTDTCALLIQ